MKTHFKTSVFVKTICIVALFVFGFSACRTAEVAVNQRLKQEAETYVVKGRQGTQIGQTLSFGGFSTDKVKRGWTFSYSIPFVVRFNGAAEKMSFTIHNGTGHAADVALVSRFRETELSHLEEYFSVSLKYANYCAGSVRLGEGDNNWEFVVHNVDGAERSLQKNSTAGFVRNGKSVVEISGIRQLEGSPSVLTQNSVYGYEFRLNGEIIGAVSTINGGKVWLKRGTEAPLQLVLASVSSALMLRNPMEEQAISLR